VLGHLLRDLICVDGLVAGGWEDLLIVDLVGGVVEVALLRVVGMLLEQPTPIVRDHLGIDLLGGRRRGGPQQHSAAPSSVEARSTGPNELPSCRTSG
jgi:hypothetical protein